MSDGQDWHNSENARSDWKRAFENSRMMPSEGGTEYCGQAALRSSAGCSPHCHPPSFRGHLLHAPHACLGVLCENRWQWIAYVGVAGSSPRSPYSV